MILNIKHISDEKIIHMCLLQVLIYIKRSTFVLNLAHNDIAVLSHQYFRDCMTSERVDLQNNILIAISNPRFKSQTLAFIGLSTYGVTEERCL